MTEQIAIIRDPVLGVGDRGSVVLTFNAYIEESIAALQVLNMDQAERAIQASGVSDVNKLNGKPCYVNVDDNHIRFVRMWKP